MLKSSIILTFILLTTACGIKTQLDQNDLGWLAFVQGDTLIFSHNLEFDTTIIVKKEIFYPPYNPISVHDKYHPQIGQIIYFNRNVPYIGSGKDMVYLLKRNPAEIADGHISFYNSTFFFDTDYFTETTDIIILNDKEFNDIIKISSSYLITRKCINIKTLWWSKEAGLLKYETCNGYIWKRIK